MAQSAKVLNRIFERFELRTLSYVIFYALSNGVNKICLLVTIFEILECKRDIFLISIKVLERKSFISSYNYQFAKIKFV